MLPPTLGYKDDVSISKTEIAKIQLEKAIELFIEENFICATTLAGAAEDIFAGSLNSRGLLSVVDVQLGQVDTLRNVKGLYIKELPSKKDLVKNWNYFRNTLKHHNNSEEETIKTNLFDGAYWMIRRALYNSSKLKIFIANQIDFENWCRNNIHINSNL